jgi:putative ABC transport system permease protein
MTLGGELGESIRIAWGQIRAHVLRSALTALGVIIGIIAVTLMGSAIGGIEIGFERSLSVLGDDILYVEKWPWHNVEDWWNYRNRHRIEARYADDLNRIIEATPRSLLVTAVPTVNTVRSVRFAGVEVRGVFTQGSRQLVVRVGGGRVAAGAAEPRRRGAETGTLRDSG